MQAHPKLGGTGAPNPAPSTEKTVYQSRVSWGPSSYPHMGFPSTEEDGMRTLDGRAHVMGYSEIDGQMPDAMERGVAPDQATMGRFNNSFKPNL